MSDYISREAAYETLSEYYHLRTEIQHFSLRDALGRVPAADVKPVARGKWKLLEGGAGRCSNCKRVLKYVWDYDSSDPFCSECGADMREEEEK